MNSKSNKYSTIHYQSYLGLEQLLSAQKMRSEELEETPAHDEMLFIIVHQVYELWFKQVIHELASVIQLFNKEQVGESNIGVAISRLRRVAQIQKLLIEQIHVMQTMTPLDFLEFRNYLFPASGFQSFQFRAIESMMGLENRITYHGQDYKSVFTDDQKIALEQIEKNGSLLKLTASWLDRTPFLKFEEFEFLEQYRIAVDNMVEEEKRAINNSNYLSQEEKEQRIRMTGDSHSYFEEIMNPESYKMRIKEGQSSFSYNAMTSALLINLYRDEPLLHGPFNLLVSLMDIDELLTTWRYRHAQMVMRMLGRKMGTGGSSGHEYLQETAQKHHIFKDLHMISTFLIPRSQLPKLPDYLKRELGFYYSHINQK